MSTVTAEAPTRFAISTDGVRLAIYESGDRSRPTVVLVHGFPDNHTVWGRAAEILAKEFHVVSYDVRGTGASGEPRNRAGYRNAQLRDDLDAVIALTSPGTPVHLMAHDWGSIQSWEAVTDNTFGDTLLSFTSISGPSLDMAGVWLRNGHRQPGNVARQLADIWYVFTFQLPRLPECLVRRGVVDALVRRSERIGVPTELHSRAARRPRRDAINGIELYRANIHRMLAPRPADAVCPVQILAPIDDAHVTVPLACEAPRPYVTDLQTHEIPGNHWVVEQDPELIVTHFKQFITTF